MTAQILAYLCYVFDEEGRFTEIESEFSGGEHYVSLDVSGKRAEEIQWIWDRTIGAFEVREKEWLQCTGPRVEREPEFSESGDSSGEGFVVSDPEDTEPVDLGADEGRTRSLDHPYSEGGSLGAVRRTANKRNLSKGSKRFLTSKRGVFGQRRQKRVSSGSSSSSSSSEAEEAEEAKVKKPSKTSGSFGNWRKTGYLRFRVDGKVVGFKERDEMTDGDWWTGGSNASPVKSMPSFSLTPPERDHLIRTGLEPWIMERLETMLGVEQSSPPPPARKRRRKKGTIVEVAMCSTNHLGCIHADCVARDWGQAELFDKNFFGKSFARILSEDAFRIASLQLEYDVKIVWVCAFQDLVREPESSAAAFSKSFVLAPSKFPFNESLTESQASPDFPSTIPFFNMQHSDH
jgi:hypothetical protein